MKTQFDHSIRTVALSNLEAMCERVSGMCHRYSITKVTTNRVHVEYSNPNEYGSEFPMTAVFPCWPDSSYDKDSRSVALTILNVCHDNWDGEGWQAFQPLMDCKPLSRPSWDSSEWKTRDEILSGTPLLDRLNKISDSLAIAIREALAAEGVTAPNASYIPDIFSVEAGKDLAENLRTLL